MLKTKNVVFDIDSVPATWVFEHYLCCDVLTGQNVKIKSVFNPNDKNPSMFVYVNPTGRYKFKDFSTGAQGDHIDLVAELFGITRVQAINKIMEDFSKNNTGDTETRIIKREIFKIEDYSMRHWTDYDAKFWQKYQIGSALLKHYNVQPLESYTYSKSKGTEIRYSKIAKNYTYGYFKEDGSLYKIYQPYSTTAKFLKVKPYIQGLEQIDYNKKLLFILASLKDLMAFTLLQFGNATQIAPDSENTTIPEKTMTKLKSKFKDVIVVFDNDDAGIKSSKKYEETFNIKSVNISLDKDLADCVKNHGVAKTRHELITSYKQKYGGS